MHHSRTASTQTLIRTVAMGVLTMALAAPAAAQTSRFRLSETAAMEAGNASSREVSASSDGRFVAFTSAATNLVAGDTNGAADIFVKDRTTGAVTRASVATGGGQASAASWNPVISSNGRYVAFVSAAPLAPADTDDCAAGVAHCNDIYVHDTQTGATAMATNWEPSVMTLAVRGVSPDGQKVLLHVTFDQPPAPTRRGVDFYIRDLSANTTWTLAPDAAPGFGVSTGRGAMRDDVKLVIYSAGQALLGAEGDPLPCRLAGSCQRLYAHDVESVNSTRRLTPRIAVDPDAHSVDLEFLDMSADGRFVLFLATLNRSLSPQAPRIETAVYRYDRVTETTTFIEREPSPHRVGAISDDGQVAVTCGASGLEAGYLSLFSRFRLEPFPPEPVPTRTCDSSVALSGDGRFVFLDAATIGSLPPPDPVWKGQIYMVDRDLDGDGMSTGWEWDYGLGTSVADGTLDADGDGVSNLDEFLANTHPTAVATRYFAEGAQNAFFETRLHLFNPSDAGTVAHVTLDGQNGQRVVSSHFVGAGQGLTVLPSTDPRYGPLAPDAAFSTVIESSQLLVAERTMSWGRGADGAPPYGSHAETAILAPRIDWHFAEGATGPYSLYYLLQNPGATPAQVDIKYLLGAGAPITHHYTVAPHSRRTIDVNGEPGLSAAEISAHVTSDVPILAERAMYVSTPTQLYAGGHEGAAVPLPATEWFVAEGATGFFSLYLTVENPGATDADIEVTYLLDSGAPIVKRHTARKEGRLTIDVAGEDPRLLTASLGAIVRSTNGVPVVVERVMWWPRAAPYEATLTAAALETGPRWAVAGALSSPAGGTETYLLIASPSGAAGSVTITLRGVDGGSQAAPCTITRPLPASTRLTVSVGEVCAGVNTDQSSTFAGTITSTTPIVAERATYGSTPDQFWATGAGAALTKLPDVP